MAKVMFTRVKKGKVAPIQGETEPDGDTPAQEREEGNTSAPGPLTKKAGGQQITHLQAHKTVKKATAKEDAAEASEGPNFDTEDAAEAKKEGSDAGKVSKPKAKVGADANADKTPAKGKARFGKPGSPIRF